MKTTTNIMLSGKIMKAFPLKIKSKTRLSTFRSYIKHFTGSFNQTLRQENEIKSIPNGKEVKLTLFADDTVSRIGNPQ